MRIGIAGISGRMGRLLVEEVGRAGAVLAGGIGRPGGAMLPGVPLLPGVALLPDIAALARSCDVVIDFTHASTVAPHGAALAATGCGWVLGTSGIGRLEQPAVTAAAAHIAVLQAANFSFGVNLMLALAERMAAALPAELYDAEILEMHHRQKVDAPSGTAIALGAAVAAGRGVALEKVIESGRHGDVGPRKTGEIGFAALRGGQVVGEHTLLFAGASEHLSLTHRAFDRRVYAAGAVQAALWLAQRPAGLYSMRHVLGLGER
ncbi:MAG: 4-hydroxy-tetrahydrodipicolinate reductase [Acetobacteraceae bacterium]